MDLAAEKWFVRNDDGKLYGPADLATLKVWAQEGRIGSLWMVSSDRVTWTAVSLIGELEMKWLVEIEPGRVFGPFHRAVVSQLFANGSILSSGRMYRLHELPIDEDPPPTIREVEKIVEVVKEVPVEKIVEKPVEVEKIVEVVKEVPVEKVVEKEVEKVVEVVKEVPVEKIVEKPVEVEKVVEVVKEVPVEKIVEVIKEVPVEKIVEKEVEVEKIVEVIKEVPVDRIVEVVKEVPVEKIVERVVEKVVEVPAHAEVVVPEVVVEEPTAKEPPVRSPGALFKGMNRERLRALEAAAQRELSHRDKFSGFFGRKK